MKNLLCAIACILFTFSLQGQDLTTSNSDSLKVLVTLINGDFVVGHILDQNETQLLLQAKEKTQTLALDEIAEVDSLTNMKNVRVSMKNDLTYTGKLLKETDSQLIIESQNGLLILKMQGVEKIENIYDRVYKKITMKDGTVYKGYTESDLGKDATIYTESGQIKYNPDQVEKIETIKPSRIGFFDHPSATRYYFSPTAIPLRKGEGYYSNQLILVNSFQYGITDNISMGAGVEAISTLFLLSPTPFGNIKIGFSPAENFHVSGGIQAGAAFGRIVDNRAEYVVSPFGAITFGDRDVNFTLGGGRAFITDDQANYFTFSGTLRLKPQLALISNNIYGRVTDLEESFYFGLLGVRILGRNADLDLALAYTDESIRSGFAIPYLGFSFKL